MFANTLTLCKFIFRRDRLTIILWIIGLLLLVLGFGATLPSMYGTEADRAVMAETMSNPAMVAMMGPMPGSATHVTLGAIYTTFMLVWTAMGVGVMNIFHVVRHTRADEEAGRIEVVRSLPTGRLANISATLLAAFILNLLIALFSGFGLAVLGNETMGLTGSLYFGASIGIIGMVFAGFTAVFCQLAATPRTAQGVSFALLILLYFLRASGDMEGNDALSVISPLGLITRAEPFVGNNIWPILIIGIVAIVMLVLAFGLNSARDMGEGIIPARPGRKNAAPYLKSAEGLAWRLLRMSVLIWIVCIPALGMAYGSIMGDMEEFIASNEIFAKIAQGDPLRLISFILIIMGVIATIPVLQFILKARSQESHGFAENLLTSAVSRTSQLKGYFIIALISCILMPFLNTVGFYAGSYPVMEDPIPFGDLLKACMVYAPALFFMLGVAVILIGHLPKFASLSWAYLAYTFLILYLGSLMGLPEWLGKLSPFGYIPQLPVDSMDSGAVVSLVGLTVIAALMCIDGFIAYNKRDMKFT
jgi:ABC-2 type transport system permease protein